MAHPLLQLRNGAVSSFPSGVLIMSKKKNPHGIRARVTTNGVLELWLGTPGEAESNCIGQFHKDYIESVRDVLTMVNRLPVIESNTVYGMPRQYAREEGFYSRDNGFLKREASKCPDCNVGLHWRQIAGMRLTEEIDGKQFYDARCPNCHTNWKVRK